MPKLHRTRRLDRALPVASLLTLTIAQAFAQTTSPALPSGVSVAAGQAQISTSGNRMTVVNTPQTILNWNSFSIGSGNAVYFQQANAGSAVLNRVTGNDPSSILGSLGSNGRVWLLNPNGVLFGAGARVDVAGLVTSTLRLNDGDWLAGRYVFTAGNPGAAVLNQGELRSSFGGHIALLGDSVANEGLVQSPGGQIVLAAGRSIELVDTGAPNLGVRISADAGAARNLGTLLAAGGRIDIHAAAVNQSGIVSADGFANGPGGAVWIKASGAIDLASASRTSADGASGGLVHVESATARTTLAGSISAQGSTGAGGEVALLGREVGLLDAATVDASGASGGGAVRVGGGLRGQDPGYANAQAVYFAPTASISANATQQGDGGQIVLWSDQATRAFGSLSVHGGALGGDGGSVETSGGWLDARPARVDTGAPRGRSGSWLLDPFDLTISDSVSTQGVAADYTAIGSGASIASATIVNALNNGTSVTVSTGGSGANSGTEPGKITVSGATLVASAAAPGNLTLIADGDISVTQSTLGSSAGPMAVQLLAGRGGAGAVSISASSIDTHGDGSVSGTSTRNITLGGFAAGSGPNGSTFTGAAGGVSVVDSSLNANGGTLSIAAAGGGAVLSSSFITADTVVVRGTNLNGTGVLVDGSTTVTAGDNLTLSGRSASGQGVLITDAALITLDAATLAGSHVLLLEGAGNGAADVAISPGETDGSSIVAGNGATLTIEGPNRIEISGGAFPAIDASGGSNVLISSNVIAISSSIEGSTTGGLLRFSGNQIAFTNNALVSAGGPIQVAAAAIGIDAGSTLRSSATGDAIVLSGLGGAAATGFVNNGGTAVLSVSTGGRYIVYVDSPAGLSSADGGLAIDFKRVGASFGGWSADTGNGLVFATGRTATANVVIADRPYNGGLNAPIGSAVVTAEGSDSGTLLANASASYADPNAGSGKAASFGSATPFSFADSNGKPIYGYTVVATPTGNVTPAALSGTPSVVTRVYDAGTVASITVGSLSGLVGSEQVTVTGSGVFNDKNVGSGKPVSASYVVGNGPGGLASNYSFNPGTQALTGTITPATLQYVATPAVRNVGAVPLDLTGSVTGFVGSDTLAADTQGAALFSALSVPNSPAGVYGVQGSGLSALNYIFTQAPGNARALTLVDPTPQTPQTPPVVASTNQPYGGAVPITVASLGDPRSPYAGVNDETAVAPVRDAPPVADFGAVRLSSLSAGDVASLLAGRRAFMDNLLADSVQRLTRDPGAADLRDCETLDQARLGLCVVTAKFKAAVAPPAATAAAAPAPAPTAAAPGSAAPAPAPEPAVAPAPAAAAPAVVAAPPATAADALAALGLGASKRAVQKAALPQIERKIALLIGVDRYQDKSIPTLGNAVNDARAVAEVFEKRLGYETVVLENATKPTLVTALNQLALTLGPHDSVIVYYAGHGELVATTQLGYWLLADSVANQPETWLSNTDIAKLIAQMGASQVALVSDSCYSGSLASEERIRALAAAPDPKAVLGRRSVVVMSSGGNEPVADDGRDGHSPFAWNLMNTLNQLNNWQAGGNVFERVRFAVARTLPQRPQYTASRSAGHQPGGDYLFEQRLLAPGR